MKVRAGPGEPAGQQLRPRIMRRLLVVLALVAPLLWWGAAPAAACSCVIRSVPELVDDADVVVTARLTDRVADRQQAVLTFHGSERFKGDLSPGFEVETSAQSSACGLTGLVEGRRYVVFADEANGELSATSCGGTAPARPGLVEKVESVTGPGMSFDLPPPGAPEQPEPPTDAPVLPEAVLEAVADWIEGLAPTFWS